MFNSIVQLLLAYLTIVYSTGVCCSVWFDVLVKIQDSSLSEFTVLQVSCASQCWRIQPLSRLKPSGNTQPQSFPINSQLQFSYYRVGQLLHIG